MRNSVLLIWGPPPPSPLPPGLVRIDYLNMNGESLISDIGLIYPFFRESIVICLFLVISSTLKARVHVKAV